MSLLESIGIHLGWKSVDFAVGHAVSRWQSKKVSPNWIARINNHFEKEIQVFCQNKFDPQITIQGRYSLTKAEKINADKERLRLQLASRPNDSHAVLVNNPLWESDPPQLDAQVLDFAGVCALRKLDKTPQVLSSSAVIVCRGEKVLLIHDRAQDAETYPGCIHTLGGAYIPPGTGGVDPDRSRPRSTVEREVREEAQIALSGDDFPPMMIAKELSTGFIQVVFLGFSVTPSALGKIEGNWEGKPLRIPFDNLPKVLKNPNWVPSGKAHILAWLALGAPNAGLVPRFGRLSPKQLFDEVIGT